MSFCPSMLLEGKFWAGEVAGDLSTCARQRVSRSWQTVRCFLLCFCPAAVLGSRSVTQRSRLPDFTTTF